MRQASSPLRSGNFLLYFSGVTLSEVGSRGTFAVNLYHIYILSGSTVLVGFVGFFQFLAVVIIGPLGGAIADRVERKRLVQWTQFLSMVVSSALALTAFIGTISPWHIYLAVLLNAAAATFDAPARRALVPGIVPRDQLVKAFALVTPGREVAHMLGPALGGLLVVVSGPELMYAVDALTYLVLIVTFSRLKVQVEPRPVDRPGLLSSIREGFVHVRSRPIIGNLLAVDVLATLFGAYRVVLPELAEDVLEVGAAGYGVLNAAVPAGALLGSWIIYRMYDRWRGGRVVLWALAAYGLACVGLAQSWIMSLALVFALLVGVFDAMGSTVRTAAIQVETPDQIRGRVSSIQQMATRGGPSLGVVNIGALSGLVGPVAALSLGGLVPVLVAIGVGKFGRTLRDYTQAST